MVHVIYYLWMLLNCVVLHSVIQPDQPFIELDFVLRYEFWIEKNGGKEDNTDECNHCFAPRHTAYITTEFSWTKTIVDDAPLLNESAPSVWYTYSL